MTISTISEAPCPLRYYGRIKIFLQISNNNRSHRRIPVIRCEQLVDTSIIVATMTVDGLYVIRTCVTAERMDSDKVVLTYKSLAKAKRAFRSFKSIDLHSRPIRHWNDNRGLAYVFLCTLACYVEWRSGDVDRPSKQHFIRCSGGHARGGEPEFASLLRSDTPVSYINQYDSSP